MIPATYPVRMIQRNPMLLPPVERERIERAIEKNQETEKQASMTASKKCLCIR